MGFEYPNCPASTNIHANTSSLTLSGPPTFLTPWVVHVPPFYACCYCLLLRRVRTQSCIVAAWTLYPSTRPFPSVFRCVQLAAYIHTHTSSSCAGIFSSSVSHASSSLVQHVGMCMRVIYAHYETRDDVMMHIHPRSIYYVGGLGGFSATCRILTFALSLHPLSCSSSRPTGPNLRR